MSWKRTLCFQLSQIIPTLTDCENRTGSKWHQTEVQRFRFVSKTSWKIDMPVLGLAGCHWREVKNENWKLVQVRRLASQSVSPDQMGVFVGSGPKWFAATPCILSNLCQLTENEISRWRQEFLLKPLEVLHLFRWFTHTLACIGSGRHTCIHYIRCSASHYICIYIQIYTQYTHTDTNSKSHKLINASMHVFMCIRHTHINMWLWLIMYMRVCICMLHPDICVRVCAFEHSYYCTSIQSHLVHAINAYQCVDCIYYILMLFIPSMPSIRWTCWTLCWPWHTWDTHWPLQPLKSSKVRRLFGLSVTMRRSIFGLPWCLEFGHSDTWHAPLCAQPLRKCSMIHNDL